MLRFLAYLILIMPLSGLAQVYDDFSDGDFTANPVWTGTESLFMVNANGQLQLNAESGGDACLFCENTNQNSGVTDFEWRFWLREAFAPSGKNFCDVVLCDKYFVRFGEAGSGDVVDLQRVDGASSVSVCRGTDTFIASAFSASFKVTRDAEGLWKIFVDKTGSGDYQIEAQGVDKNYEPTGDFGIKITYTSSNAKKVYFDDVYFGSKIIDTEPPYLKNLTVLKYNKIQLDFSEPIDDIYALDSDNYSIDNGLGKPMYAEFAWSKSTLILSYSNKIQEDMNYTLKINKIQDLSGNIAENMQRSFVHHTVHENDIVINEIMADPEPSVGLPSFEYVELFNTTEAPINLKDWVFTVGNGEKIITEDVVIQANGYLILCKTDAVQYLNEFGDCYGFSSLSITNAGVYMSLKNADDVLVSDVSFNMSWYHDNEKSEGGWSLEQIDPYSPCAGESNWMASCDRNGGTPGKINSVDDDNPVAPAVDYVNVLSDNTIELVFNQKMDRNELTNINNYTLEDYDIHPYDAIVPDGKSDRVQLYFEQGFINQSVFIILVFGSSCSGMPLPSGHRCAFGLPDEAVGGDVVINEILFDPIAPAADYVELYNKSDKILNISRLKIGAVKTSFPSPPDTTVKRICEENRLLLPHEYLLLTKTPNEIAYQYDCSADNFIRMESFPSYPNDGAKAVLYYDDEIVDIMSYDDDSHYPLLTVTKGVSLERVNPDFSSSDSDNWHSAAAPLYGTPGYKNSVSIENPGDNAEVVVFPPVFSPDNDGFDDVTTINLTSFSSDYSASISVLNSQGGFINNLVHGQNIGHQSFFVWNGTDENGKIVPVGIYIIYVELFDTQGVVKRLKKTVVVACK